MKKFTILLLIIFTCGCGSTLELQEDKCCETHVYHQRPIHYNWWLPKKPNQNYVIINNYKPNKPNHNRPNRKPRPNNRNKK